MLKRYLANRLRAVADRLDPPPKMTVTIAENIFSGSSNAGVRVHFDSPTQG